MKSKGHVIDNNGRLVIPKTYRTALGVDRNCEVAMKLEGDKLIVTKAKETELCAFCSSADDLVHFKHDFICKKCFNEIKARND